MEFRKVPILQRCFFPPKVFRRFGSVLFALLVILPMDTVAQTPATYTVRSGDYLMAIAQRYGVSLAEINQANNLQTDIILPGQNLKIPNALLSLESDDIRFARPCRKHGIIVQPFGEYKEDGIRLPHPGIEFMVPQNTRMTSIAHGVVKHVGLITGLGIIMVVEHGGGYHTVMGPFAQNGVQVRVGDAVVQGQTLGTVAVQPKDKTTYVHLELRMDTVAIDPTFLLE